MVYIFPCLIFRYADVIVHRLLAACLGCDVTHATLLDTKTADALCDNLNYRHRQAQYAGRASVALNTHVSYSLPILESFHRGATNALSFLIKKGRMRLKRMGEEGQMENGKEKRY